MLHKVRLNICIIVLLAGMLHIPMALQFNVEHDEKNGWRVSDNKQILCTQPWAKVR